MNTSLRTKGFSLIELLVVMFIIGLLVSAVSLSVNIGGDPEEQLEGEALRLLELSRLAEERAVLTGEPVGLVIRPPLSSLDAELAWRYQWQYYRSGQWVEAQSPFVTWQLPGNIEVSLEVEGELVNFARLNNDRNTPPLPSVVFYPGGEVTPFYLTLFDAEVIDQRQVLMSNRIGRVEIETDEAL